MIESLVQLDYWVSTRTSANSTKSYFVWNVGHLLKRQGQLHSVPLHSDSCTRVRLARGRRTYARASDVCTRAGLMFRRRTYARAPDFGTGAGLMYRRRSCAPAPVLCTGAALTQRRRTYAEAPDLCAGAGLMHRHMILISYRESVGSY